MRKLTIQEQMFVCCFFENPKSATKAADRAGYTSETNQGLRKRAERLMADPRIQEAIREESRNRNVFLLPKAHEAVSNLLDNPQATGHVAAIKMVRDDAGVTRAVERVLNVNVQVSREDKLRELKEFAAAHGGTVLGVPIEHITGETTDAEFEEIPPPRSAGLEDLI